MGSQDETPIDFHLPEPAFDSALTTLVIELEKLRTLRLQGTTPSTLFFELKQIFQMLESVGSARLEGNRTTIAQFIETQLEDRPFVNEDIEEIRNIERAIRWVEAHAMDYPVNRAFVSELHKLIVENLTPPPDGEGDQRPGAYRVQAVEITGSGHVPPPPYLIDTLMEDMFAVINAPLPPKYDLLKAAMAHHRFMWIHPFGNGNGRTGRLLTYAMLIKAGFRLQVGRILNPTAIFCIDRNRYNEMLAAADSGTREAYEQWCMYVLEGLKTEIEKVERLGDAEYVTQHLLLPALQYSRKMKHVDSEEYAILKLAASRPSIQARDVEPIFPGKHAVTISRKIKALRDKNMLKPVLAGGNKYHLSFVNNFLIRGIIHALAIEGYIPWGEERN